MAYASIGTFTAGDVLTAGTMNQVQDNFDLTAPAVMTTKGDLVKGGTSGVPARFGIGSASQVLRTNAAADDLEWVAPGDALSTGWEKVQDGTFTNSSAQTLTVSGRRRYMLMIELYAGNVDTLSVQFNGVTSNYYYSVIRDVSLSTGSALSVIDLCNHGSGAFDYASVTLFIQHRQAASNYISCEWIGYHYASGGPVAIRGGGRLTTAQSAITEIKLLLPDTGAPANNGSYVLLGQED